MFELLAGSCGHLPWAFTPGSVTNQYHAPDTPSIPHMLNTLNLQGLQKAGA